MKFSRSGITAGVLALTLSAGACDSFTGLNENPNGPRDVDPEVLFPQGAVRAVALVRGAGVDMHLASLWAQHYSKIQYVDEDWYQIRPQNVDAYWTAFYAGGAAANTGALQDLTDAIERADSDPRPARQEAKGDYIGPALVMKAWTFQAMTDLWGDIPYTEANLGPAGPIAPKYDPQEEIYDSLFASLAAATAMMDPDGDSYGAADPIYGGDMAQWQKFSNSLRLRLAMRISNVAETKAQAEYNAALAAEGGVFTSNADNAELVWAGDGTNDNPFFVNFKTRDDHRVSATMVDTLLALDDPRLEFYARPTQDAPNGYVGVPNGLETDDALGMGLSKTSKIGTWFSSASSPSILMQYSEVLFIRAEAAARGWGGDAASLYNQAITASMQVYGIPQGEIDAYLAQPEVAYNAATGLEQIAFQKWISLFNQGTEAYAEWRRSGQPVLTPGPGAIIDIVPRRLTYPAMEQSLNSANLAEATSNQGGASLEDRVWWDVN